MTSSTRCKMKQENVIFDSFGGQQNVIFDYFGWYKYRTTILLVYDFPLYLIMKWAKKLHTHCKNALQKRTFNSNYLQYFFFNTCYNVFVKTYHVSTTHKELLLYFFQISKYVCQLNFHFMNRTITLTLTLLIGLPLRQQSLRTFLNWMV